MAEHKNSHKGVCTGSQIGKDTEDGPMEKNKTRQKYMTSIPLQENQSLTRSTNLDLHKLGKGNSPRPGSRARSEVSDTLSETEISPMRTQTQLEREPSPSEKLNSPNPCKRRAMEEEDSLDMTLCSTSRPITPSPNNPSEENGIN